MSRSTGTTFVTLRAFGVRRPRDTHADNSLRFCAAWLVAMLLIIGTPAHAAECLPDCQCPTPKLLIAHELPVTVDQALLQRQFETLSRMSLDNVEYSPLGPVREVWGNTGLVLPAAALKLRKGDSGAAVLKLLGNLLLAHGDEVLTLEEVNLLEGPYASIGSMWFLQSIRGIPVIHGGVAINYDGKTRHIQMLSASFIPNRELPSKPKLTAKQAERRVPGNVMERSTLGYYAPWRSPGSPRLVWAVHAWSEGLGQMFYVDALTGEIVDRRQTTVVG